jgi:hypothetical protein
MFFGLLLAFVMGITLHEVKQAEDAEKARERNEQPAPPSKDQRAVQ